jgi:hypothetical protein
MRNKNNLLYLEIVKLLNLDTIIKDLEDLNNLFDKKIFKIKSIK